MIVQFENMFNNAVIPQMPSTRILHKSFSRGLCEESDDCFVRMIE